MKKTPNAHLEKRKRDAERLLEKKLLQSQKDLIAAYVDLEKAWKAITVIGGRAYADKLLKELIK